MRWLSNLGPCWARALTLSALVLSGCRHASPMRVEGGSSFAFIDEPTSSSNFKAEIATGPRQPVDAIVSADPILPLTKPVYPPAALGRHRVPVVVGVRITVDENGRVVQVGPSLRVFSTPGPFATDFMSAIEEALAQWRFTPAEKRHLVPGRGGPGGEDYWVITRAEKTECAFDLAFTFTASGDVLAGTPQ